MTPSIAFVIMLSSFAAAFIAGLATRSVVRWRDAKAAEVKPRYVVEFEDGVEEGEWCSFATLAQARNAVTALNDVYNGAKRFWLEGAPRPYDAPLEAPKAPSAVAEPVTPLAKQRARPKPGTPIVRQRNGRWYVQTGRFEIGYGTGAEGYHAALSAVERVHQQ